MGEWAPTATATGARRGPREPSRWGNGRQPQLRQRQAQAYSSLADGGMGANRNGGRSIGFSGDSLADGGMGANRN